jgi:acetyl/propionyl-CoA carboxylase alpha subunit
MEYHYQQGQEQHTVFLEEAAGGLRALIAGQSYGLEILEQTDGQLVLRIQDQIVDIHWAEADGKRWISYQGCTYLLEKPSLRRTPRSQESGLDNQLRAPMPAQVREVLAAVGDAVQMGDTLLILEAMKMEIRLTAPGDARVVRVEVTAGDSVARDQLLVELEQT